MKLCEKSSVIIQRLFIEVIGRGFDHRVVNWKELSVFY